VAVDFGRLELGRRLLAPGRVLALDAVRGLAEVARAVTAPPFGLAEVRRLAVLDLAVLDLAGAGFMVPALVVLALDRAAADFGLAVVRALAVPADLAGRRADARLGLAVLDRFAVARAGRAGVAGLATDSVFAAVVRALAAVVMALVALFIDCIAVDIVLADEVARVAAVVILDAAELTLVAALETVRAAVAGVGWEPRDELRRAVGLMDRRAAVLRVLRRAVPLVLRAVVLRAVLVALLPVLRLVPPVLRVDFAAVLRAAGWTPVTRVLALVLGRPAERLTALVLIDRVLREAAGLRRAVARDVVCTGTDFPPS
jgi:hypothetical protein